MDAFYQIICGASYSTSGAPETGLYGGEPPKRVQQSPARHLMFREKATFRFDCLPSEVNLF